MAPELLAKRRKKNEETQELQQERRRLEQVERLREMEQRQRNAFSGRTAQPQAAGPQVRQEVRKEEPVSPPPIPPVQAPLPKEADASPKPAAPQAVERRQTRETTRTEKLDLGHYDSSGKHEAVEGQNKVVVQELDRIERLETPQDGAQVEAEKERRLEKESALRRMEAKTAQVVPAQKLQEQAGIVQAEKKPEMEKESARIAEARPDARMAGPASETDEEARRQVRRTLDEAFEHNRPALLVSLVMKKEEEGPLDLMQVDERRARLLVAEVDARIRKAGRDKYSFAQRVRKEKDEGRKQVLRAKWKKICISLAFYTKVKGMLSRILGGFFGKLLGGLMK
ncbi:Uncharacterised protein [uncultured archaeon]|nr:Uncharacterised protein [uncultured archaeon]